MVKTTNILLGTTRDGYNVYDREDSHLHTEGGMNKELVNEAISYMYANNARFKVKTVHFRRNVGICCLVPITEADDVIMVYRKGRQGPTPMVKNRQGEKTNAITIIIRKERNVENHYTLITAFVGEQSFPEPWDKQLKEGSKELAESIEFWSTHALLYNEEVIDHLA